MPLELLQRFYDIQSLKIIQDQGGFMKLFPIFALFISTIALAHTGRYIPDENHISDDAIQEEQERQDVKILQNKHDEKGKIHQHHQLREKDPTYNSIDENLREKIQNLSLIH